MQAASNFLQDKVLGGPVPIDQAATPEYKHRADGSTMKALTWQGTNKVKVVDAPVPEITEDKDVILKVTGACDLRFARSPQGVDQPAGSLTLLRPQAAPSVARTCTSTTARSSPCSRATSSATSAPLPFPLEASPDFLRAIAHADAGRGGFSAGAQVHGRRREEGQGRHQP
jgi:hypothetical protein